MMKRIITLFASLMFVFCCLWINNGSRSNELLEMNISALSDNENGYGWLWEKHWSECMIALQIIVNRVDGSGAVQSQTFEYNASLAMELARSGTDFTITYGNGQKSYCYDGWSFCSSDDCR